MIKDFLIAIGNFRKYGELAEKKGLRVAGYCILLLLVCSIGLIVIPTFTMGAKTISVIWEDIPEFTLTSDGFTVDKDFSVELYGVKVYATNSRQLSATDFGEKIISGVLMDEDSVIIRNFSNTMEFGYNEFGKDFVIRKGDLIALKPVLIISGLFTCALLFVSRLITFVLNGLFIGAVSGIIAIFMKRRIPVGILIKLGMYSQTLPLVASAILALFGVFGESLFLYVVSVGFIVLWLRTGNEPENTVDTTEN